MANLSRSAFEILKFRHDDRLEDHVFELADLLELPINKARDIVSATLRHYHLHQGSYPTEVPQIVYKLTVHITQPTRIPEMTERMDWVIQQLLKDVNLTTVLDYGGGGGKDSIIYAKLGYRVTYSDFIDLLTPYVRKRFDIHGLNVDMLDVRNLGEQRFDVVNCMDVIEHVYDVEYVTADIFAHMSYGGHLMAYPSFFNSWNGDHIEKNCGYKPYFQDMLQGVGLEVVDRRGDMLHCIRRRPLMGTVEQEREIVRRELYLLSQKYSFGMAMQAMAQENILDEDILSQMIDNLAIWRLSRHRLVNLHHRKKGV